MLGLSVDYINNSIQILIEDMARTLGGETIVTPGVLDNLETGAPKSFRFYQVSHKEQTLILTGVCKDVDTTMGEELTTSGKPTSAPSVREVVTGIKNFYGWDLQAAVPFPIVIPIAQAGKYSVGINRRHYVLGVLIGDSNLYTFDSLSANCGFLYRNPILRSRIKGTKAPYHHSYVDHYFCYENQIDNYNCGRFVLSLITQFLVLKTYSFEDVCKERIHHLVSQIKAFTTSRLALSLFPDLALLESQADVISKEEIDEVITSQFHLLDLDAEEGASQQPEPGQGAAAAAALPFYEAAVVNQGSTDFTVAGMQPQTHGSGSSLSATRDEPDSENGFALL